MQVFTRSVNYCKWSQCCERLLGSLCMYRWHHSMTGNRKQRPRKKTNSQNTRTKQKQKTGKPKNKNRTPQLGMVYPKAAMRRNDKAACVPSPERVILETTAQGQNLTRWPGGAKQKSRGAETRDPPSQDPGDRITKPCRHDKHRCTSIASICRAVWKTRWWNKGETEVRHTEWKGDSSNIYRPLRVLSRVLWQSSSKCSCLIVKPVMEGQLGTFPRDIAVTYAVFCMSLSSMVKQPTAGTLSWRFIQLASGKTPKANMVSRLCITRLVVAGLGSHFLVSWSVRCIAWLIFIMGNTRNASELECTVGCSAMLCPHVYELQLLRNQCLFQNIGQCFNSDV